MMEELVGQSLGRYRINELLGEGGMGAVFRARDLTLQRDVALKVMQPQMARRPDFQERFLQEARSAARLSHPGIVKVHDFGQARGFLYIVMELIPGRSLRERLSDLAEAGNTMPLREGLELVRRVCLAVHAAHQHGILHRDIKPDNIVLMPEPAGELPYQPVLTDLGLAKLLEGGMMTQEGTSLGTPAYMSPEQAMGEETDARSDVYSLGILLYELATGRLPFPIKTLTEAIRYHTKEPPPPPRAIRPDIPEPLERAIMRALEKRPEARFADAGAMADALAALPPAAAGGGPQEGAASLVTQHRETVQARGPSILKEFPSPPADLSQDRIAVLAPDGSVRAVDCRVGELTIGRGPDNDLVLDSPKVSRQHAQVEYDGAVYRVTDLNSTNGTYLANSRLLPGVPDVWTPDKPLRLGDHWLRLEPAQQADAGTVVDSGGTVVSPTTASHSAAGRVGAFLDTPEISVDPGSSATVSATILNQGPVVDHFRVTIQGLPAHWLPASPPLIRLLPGTQQQVSLAVQPPRSPESRAGTYPLTIRVASQDAPDQVAELAASLTVSAFQQFNVELRPQKQSGPRVGRFRLQIQNWGNGGLAVELAAVDPEEACEYTFEPSQGSVPAGQEGTVQLYVRPKAPLPGEEPKSHPFTVTLHPPGTPWLAKQVQGEWVQTPRPARAQLGCGFALLWFLATAAGGVLGGALFALIDWGQVEPALGWALTQVLMSTAQGACVAVLQWLIMLRHLRRSGWWLVATTVGFSLYGWVMMGAMAEEPYAQLWASILAAGLLGAAQWAPLYRQVRWSGLWVPATMFGWPAGRYVISSTASQGLIDYPAIGWRLAETAGPPLFEFLERNAIAPGPILERFGWGLAWAIVAAVAGAITGLAMWWLLSHPAEDELPAPAGP